MRSKLETGWVRARLIRQLAMDEKSQHALAAEYGCTQQAIHQFARRHETEIQHQRENLADEWAGLWIADKRNRVAEYQSDVEQMTESLQRDDDPAMRRAKLATMRQVSEELGQLKQEIEVTGALTYVVEGVDLGKL